MDLHVFGFCGGKFSYMIDAFAIILYIVTILNGLIAVTFIPVE